MTSPIQTLNDYQEKAATFIVPTSNPGERVFGLLSEAGEVAGVFQKMTRGDYDAPEAMARLHKELGDVLWYVAGVAADNNWTLEDIANTNIEKLESRRLRKALLGDGDNR